MYCAVFATQVVLLTIIFYLLWCDRARKIPWFANRLSSRKCTRDLSGIAVGVRYTVRAVPCAKWVEFFDPILPSFARDGIEHLYVEIETPNNGCVIMGVRRTGRTSTCRPHSLLDRCDIQIPDCSLMRATKYIQCNPFELNLRQGIQVGRTSSHAMILVGKPVMRGQISDAQLRVIQWFGNHKVVQKHWDAVRLENSQFDFMAPWSTCPLAMSCQMFCQLFHQDPSELLSRLIKIKCKKKFDSFLRGYDI